MNELVRYEQPWGLTVSLGPTLLSLGSVQTFCIDPLEEVFGVEVRTGVTAAGRVGGITLAMAGQVKE
jgi:hypothetical protein